MSSLSEAASAFFVIFESDMETASLPALNFIYSSKKRRLFQSLSQRSPGKNYRAAGRGGLDLIGK